MNSYLSKIKITKKTKLTWVKYLRFFKTPQDIKSISLTELLVSIMIMGIMILSFYSLENFSYEKVLSADRRAKVQNALAYSLDTMGQIVLKASGDINNPPIKLYSASGSAPWTGFQVRFDCQAPQTPSDLTNDVWIYYTLSGNDLSVGCRGLNCGSCGTDNPVPPISPGEVLSSKIVANFSNTLMPEDPLNTGFYVLVDPLGNKVDVGLVGRYYPDQTPTLKTRLTNPQVAMKTKLICNNSSTN
jgi:hypothetical protein